MNQRLLGCSFLYMSIVNNDALELNSEESELINAANKPPTTSPLKPTGNSVETIVGNTLSPSSTLLPSTIFVGI